MRGSSARGWPAGARTPRSWRRAMPTAPRDDRRRQPATHVAGAPCGGDRPTLASDGEPPTQPREQLRRPALPAWVLERHAHRNQTPELVTVQGRETQGQQRAHRKADQQGRAGDQSRAASSAASARSRTSPSSDSTRAPRCLVSGEQRHSESW